MFLFDKKVMLLQTKDEILQKKSGKFNKIQINYYYYIKQLLVTS